MLGLALVLLTEAFDAPVVRAALLVATMFAALSVSRRYPRLLSVFAVPVLMLLASHSASHGDAFAYVRAVLPAFLAVLAFSGLGHWLFWTLRSGRGSVPA